MSAAVDAPVEADLLASVVVPTRNRPEQAAACVRALLEQSPPFRFEVVVVDDGRAKPFDAREFARVDAPVIVLRTQQSGPAAARNVGVAAARGTYICFIDDDCIPGLGWLEHITRAAAAAPGSVVSGQTVNAFPANSFAEASQHVTNVLAQPDGSNQRMLTFAPSSNICCARSIVIALPFDVHFPAAAGEDRDWCTRVIEAGHSIRPTPDAPVIHHQRLRLGTFWRQQIRYGRGGFDFRHLHGGAWHLARPSFYLKLVAGAFRIRTSVGLLVLLAQAATAVGYLAEASDRLTAGSAPKSARRRDETSGGNRQSEPEDGPGGDRGADHEEDSHQRTLPFPIGLRLPPSGDTVDEAADEEAEGRAGAEEPFAADGVV